MRCRAHPPPGSRLPSCCGWTGRRCAARPFFNCRRTPLKTGFCGNAKPNAGLSCRAKLMTLTRGRVMRPDSSGSLTCQGWGASRGIKGGSAPLARSYRGPDNVAGPIMGHLNPARAVVPAVPTPPNLVSHVRWKVARAGGYALGLYRVPTPSIHSPFSTFIAICG